MSEMTEIIMRLLWRVYPIAWLTNVIVRALSRIASWLEDEQSLSQLAHSPQDCALVGGWLALAEDRLNELIVRKAMKLLNRRYLPPPPPFAGHHPARSVRTPQEIHRRLCRLIALYHDHKRLYELRARKLERLFAKAELQLEVIHHPVAAQPSASIVGMLGMVGTIGVGGGVGGGGVECARRIARHPAKPIRAPPWLDLSFHKSNPSQPAALTCETERLCLKRS